MKYEDYYKQMNALKDEERKITSKMRELKKKYIDELPFKIDDKVEIKDYGIGWISSIILGGSGNLRIRYHPPKRNGEKSKNYHDAYGVKLEDVKIL